MANIKPYKIKTIGEYHRLMHLPKPQHPLVSVIKFEDIKPRTEADGTPKTLINNFYSIALKKTFNAKMKYGRREYDFDEGVLAFIAPNQLISVVTDENEEWNTSGWLLLIHPDFLWDTSLANKIPSYDFFGYSLNEALHLSEKEETILTDILHNIEEEYHSNIDKFSQDVIIAQLEVLLKYSERFYERQFITRKKRNHQVLDRLEETLNTYFNSDLLDKNGLPSVQYVAEQLHLSPNYLRSLLTILTGQSTQQHIHNKLIEKAKEKLSTTNLSISEIAYGLGFEHPQSFSKLFKTKTDLSPSNFRQSFN